MPPPSSFPDSRPESEATLGFQPLSEDDINAFFDDLDKDGDGFVVFDELEAKLEEVHQEIAPQPKEHHLHHPARSKAKDLEKGTPSPDSEHDGLCAFLTSLMPDHGARMDRATFIDHVRKWNVPSPSQTSSEDEARRDAEYEHHLPFLRRVRAHWSVEGPQYLFFAFVVALQLAFCIWQGVKYVQDPLARAALGWGVIMAKFSAGALYPTLFFVFLSMSRWFSTFMRRFYYISRFINWDHHQAFHVIVSCEAFVFATLHAIGHLTGTFLYGSRPAQQDDLALILGPEAVPKPYVGFVRTTPGWTGLVAYGLFLLIVICSLPIIRKRSYEFFQLVHLLMFPFGGMLCAHGTASLLQPPALGYVLAFPLLMVISERLHRLYRGFVKVPARMELLDEGTVSITCKHPKGQNWRYCAGQYVFLQVPAVAFFQWHPFTVSSCRDHILQLHIKCEDGGWTERLRNLPVDEDINVGLDGPFGAPAQRFYNFDRSIIMGAGIGITPFSAILTDLEQKVSGKSEDPWRSGRKSRRSSLALSSRRSSRKSSRVGSRGGSRSASKAGSRAPSPDARPPPPPTAKDVQEALAEKTHEHRPRISIAAPPLRRRSSTPAASLKSGVTSLSRRVDFIWSVRERNNLLWFSSLLNRVHDLSSETSPTLTVNIRPYITARRKGISTHVFRYLLDRYRTTTSPVSALTGLKMTSNFGRPDLEGMLEDFHRDMKDEGFRGKVGVFFCGNPNVGRVLSDACQEMTARARADGSGVRYVFMMEVFG